MPDIKTKKVAEKTIKVLDRTAIYTERMKDNIVNIKDKANYNSAESNSPDEYGANKITESSNIIFHKSTNAFNKYGQKSTKDTINNIKNLKQKKLGIKQIKQKELGIKKIKSVANTTKGTIQKTKKTIKTAEKTGKNTIKATKKITKTAVNGAKKAYQIAKASIKATIKGARLAIKAMILAIKGILLATKALIAFLIAGGWIVVIIIIVICLIAMLYSSIFGIFFASENTGSTITVGETQQIITMNKVIADLNKEFTNKITQIQRDNSHTEYDINSNRASWKDVLAIYSVRVNGRRKRNGCSYIE